ncbi:hypothetical protein [Streptomyces sp. NPDC040750]|uniref:hypothetical protein n=1 Tax=Streptomyces sp. NPDC040750 TaxID=3154491 RepID=UPI0033E5C1BF
MTPSATRLLAAAQHSPMDDKVLTLINVAVILVISAIVIVSQFNVREVRAQTYLWCVLLGLRGLLPPGPSEATASGITFLVIGLLFSFGFGYYRGRTIPMWRDQTGRLLRKGNRLTLFLWLGNLLERFVLGAIAAAFFGEPFNGTGIWLSVGVTLAAQQWAMQRRAPGITEQRSHESSAVPSSAAVRENGAETGS